MALHPHLSRPGFIPARKCSLAEVALANKQDSHSGAGLLLADHLWPARRSTLRLR